MKDSKIKILVFGYHYFKLQCQLCLVASTNVNQKAAAEDVCHLIFAIISLTVFCGAFQATSGQWTRSN